MKALTVESFKPYAEHKVQEQPSAPMKPGHIRIDVKAAGLNFPDILMVCLLYTSPSPRDQRGSRMPSSA